jgi:hypothetical protein
MSNRDGGIEGGGDGVLGTVEDAGFCTEILKINGCSILAIGTR